MVCVRAAQHVFYRVRIEGVARYDIPSINAYSIHSIGDVLAHAAGFVYPSPSMGFYKAQSSDSQLAFMLKALGPRGIFDEHDLTNLKSFCAYTSLGGETGLVLLFHVNRLPSCTQALRPRGSAYLGGNKEGSNPTIANEAHLQKTKTSNLPPTYDLPTPMVCTRRTEGIYAACRTTTRMTARHTRMPAQQSTTATHTRFLMDRVAT
jgi:hypothetical protein